MKLMLVGGSGLVGQQALRLRQVPARRRRACSATG
jgi:hypothetical protein